MKLYCTLIDTCGWYDQAKQEDQFICPVCGSLALPWEDTQTDTYGNTISFYPKRDDETDSEEHASKKQDNKSNKILQSDSKK